MTLSLWECGEDDKEDTPAVSAGGSRRRRRRRRRSVEAQNQGPFAFDDMEGEESMDGLGGASSSDEEEGGEEDEEEEEEEDEEEEEKDEEDDTPAAGPAAHAVNRGIGIACKCARMVRKYGRSFGSLCPR